MNSSFGGGSGGIVGGGIATQLNQENIEQQIQVAVSSSISNSSIVPLNDDNTNNNFQQQILTNVTNRATNGGSLIGVLPRLDELPLDEEQGRGLSGFNINMTNNKVEKSNEIINKMDEQEEEKNDQIFSESLENNEEVYIFLIFKFLFKDEK
jgi:hypothetical protein